MFSSLNVGNLEGKITCSQVLQNQKIVQVKLNDCQRVDLC